MKDDRRNDWMIIGAVALILVGGWLLLNRAFGSWFAPLQTILAFAGRLAWPVTLIVLGVLLYLAGQRGGFGGNAQGRRLYRSRGDRMIAGVLGGLGSYLGIDPTWLRIAYVIFGLTTWGLSLLVYVVGMIVIPEEPAGSESVSGPTWPSTGAPTVTPSRPSSGWPHTTGHESVQTPPPAPPVAPQSSSSPEPPAAPDANLQD